MPDTREQIIERMARAEWGIVWPNSDPALASREFIRTTAAALRRSSVRAVTDRVREMANLQALSCHASPLEYGPERPWLDLLALLDQIDAELGGE